MGQRKVFISYTKADKEWAWWIGGTLRDAGHIPFVYEWELGPGSNIPAWMEKRLGEADRAIGVFSDDYCGATFSTAERNASIWRDEYGETGFFIPVEVRKVTKWPVFSAPLVRLSFVGRTEDEAEKMLLAALEPPAPPKVRPPFPGLEGALAGYMGGILGRGIGMNLVRPQMTVSRKSSYTRDGAPAVDHAAERRRRAEAHGNVVVPEAEALPAERRGFPPK